MKRFQTSHGGHDRRTCPAAGAFHLCCVPIGSTDPDSGDRSHGREPGHHASLFGIGTAEARYTYRIGPTFAGRVQKVSVDVGDRVSTGQVLGEMDPVDLDDRVAALKAALKRADA